MRASANWMGEINVSWSHIVRQFGSAVTYLWMCSRRQLKALILIYVGINSLLWVVGRLGQPMSAFGY